MRHRARIAAPHGLASVIAPVARTNGPIVTYCYISQLARLFYPAMSSRYYHRQGTPRLLFFVELWAPIIASACTTFVLAVLLRMISPLHRAEWKHLPKQTEVQQLLRTVPLPPGLYMLPHMTGQDLGRADMRTALEQGPVAYLAIAKNGVPSASGRMVGDFLYFLVVNVLVGYAAWHGFSTINSGIRHMPLGIPFGHVARVVFVISGLAYAASAFRQSVWHGRPWSSFVLTCVDAALYAAAAAALFGWLWPI
jgi:hypothetical protein